MHLKLGIILILIFTGCTNKGRILISVPETDNIAIGFAKSVCAQMTTSTNCKIKKFDSTEEAIENMLSGKSTFTIGQKDLIFSTNRSQNHLISSILRVARYQVVIIKKTGIFSFFQDNSIDIQKSCKLIGINDAQLNLHKILFTVHPNKKLKELITLNEQPIIIDVDRSKIDKSLYTEAIITKEMYKLFENYHSIETDLLLVTKKDYSGEIAAAHLITDLSSNFDRIKSANPWLKAMHLYEMINTPK